MAEAEGVGEHGGGDEFGVVIWMVSGVCRVLRLWLVRVLTQEDAGGGPDDSVNQHEQADEAEGGQGDGCEIAREAPLGWPFRTGEGHD